MNASSQEAQILRYLKSGKTLTQRNADRLFDCWRLGGRIYDLRLKGYDIKTEMVSSRSRKRFASYRMA